jgi:hypothetical protein
MRGSGEVADSSPESTNRPVFVMAINENLKKTYGTKSIEPSRQENGWGAYHPGINLEPGRLVYCPRIGDRRPIQDACPRPLARGRWIRYDGDGHPVVG